MSEEIKKTTQPKDTRKIGPRTPRTGAPRTGGRPGGSRAPFEKAKPEFEQRIIAIRRVTRVVAGGRRMSFAVAMVIGDRKGLVGLGTGKAGDTALAITKAQRNAKKNLIKITTTKTGSIPHDVEAKYGSAKIFIMPNKGKGLVAGSAARDILNLAGLKDITAKYHSGTKNKLNNARAAMLALAQIGTKGRPSSKDEE